MGRKSGKTTSFKRIKLSEGPPEFVPPTARQIELEFEALRSQSKANLTDFQDVFAAIRKDPNAWPAFEKIVRCGYKQDHLLMDLGITSSHDPNSEFSNGNNWDDWGGWNAKWKGLESVVKTLTRVATKMEEHIGKSDRGPMPLPTLSGSESGSADYHKSNASGKRLSEIHSSIEEMTKEIKQYCEMRRTWKKAVPRTDIIEDESLGLLLRSIKARTGKWYLAEVAVLLNAVDISVGAETLRKMLKFHTPLLDASDPRTGYRWSLKPENSE